MTEGRSRPLRRPEIEKFAESIRALLADTDANPSRDARLRWEGALTALERVLGQEPSLSPGGVWPVL
jgi:hypothetical protein